LGIGNVQSLIERFELFNVGQARRTPVMARSVSDEAIQFFGTELVCFAALAMTQQLPLRHMDCRIRSGNDERDSHAALAEVCAACFAAC
jgi:hypothetical protein